MCIMQARVLRGKGIKGTSLPRPIHLPINSFPCSTLSSTAIVSPYGLVRITPCTTLNPILEWISYKWSSPWRIPPHRLPDNFIVSAVCSIKNPLHRRYAVTFSNIEVLCSQQEELSRSNGSALHLSIPTRCFPLLF